MILVVLYFALLIVMALLLRRVKGAEDYFVAGRGFGWLLLFFTMAATNFSAFFFLGFADAAYRVGYAEYGIMALGTAFMPVMFYVLGRRVWRLGKEKGYMTAPELVRGETGDRVLGAVIALVMIIFTLPYLAVQTAGAGYIINTLTGLDTLYGGIAVALVMAFYISLGGMRASGWTDVVQGVLMFTAIILAGVFIASALGGFRAAGDASYTAAPQLFSRSSVSPLIWLGFIFLWIFVDPMFPHLFSRFYTAKDETALKKTMIMYPLVVSFLFLIPVMIGVWAHGAGVEAGTNMVMLTMVKMYTPPWLFYLVMLGALSALMSTADSQVFALASIFTRDLGLGKLMDEVMAGKLTIWLITAGVIVYTVIFLNSGEPIMDFLVKNAFSGLVVISPVVLMIVYGLKSTTYVHGVILGEAAAILLGTVIPLSGLVGMLITVAVALIRCESVRFRYRGI